jgi:hypothetical protein
MSRCRSFALNATLAIVRCRDGGVYMVYVTVCLIAFLVLIVWRGVFATLQTRQLVQEMAGRQHRELNLLGGASFVVIAGGRLDNGAQCEDPFDGKDRAQTYLHRILALTGATQTGRTFVLEVGTTRFYVRDRHVRRLREVIGPTCKYEETCFCLPYKAVPTAEQIATALLELTNNPAVFDRWAARVGAVKADGQVFSCAQ